MAKQSSVTVEKTVMDGKTTFIIRGYTAAIREALDAAGAVWVPQRVRYEYQGEALPKGIKQAIDNLSKLDPLNDIPQEEAKPSSTAKPSKPIAEFAQPKIDTKLADALRKAAISMQKDIDHKNRPFGDAGVTGKRVREYQTRKYQAHKLMVIQDKIRAVVDAILNDTLDESLRGIKTRQHIENLAYPHGVSMVEDLFGRDVEKFNRAVAAMKALGNPEVGKKTRADELEEMRLDVALHPPEDYFPTSMPWLIDKMLAAANIQAGDTVLEPSAGAGHIAQAIREQHPDAKLIVIEWANNLRGILERMDFELIGEDFLEYNGKVDKIIQNPPFSNGKDVDHVRHAYNCLKEGGRLVSIMSRGSSFRQDKKAREYRKWLEEVGATAEELEGSPFVSSENPTSVAVNLIVIDKPVLSDHKGRYGRGDHVEYVGPKTTIGKYEILPGEVGIVTCFISNDTLEALAAVRFKKTETDDGVSIDLPFSHIKPYVKPPSRPIEIEPEVRQEITERYRELLPETETPLDAAIQTLDEHLQDTITVRTNKGAVRVKPTSVHGAFAVTPHVGEVVDAFSVTHVQSGLYVSGGTPYSQPEATAIAVAMNEQFTPDELELAVKLANSGDHHSEQFEQLRQRAAAVREATLKALREPVLPYAIHDRVRHDITRLTGVVVELRPEGVNVYASDGRYHYWSFMLIEKITEPLEPFGEGELVMDERHIKGYVIESNAETTIVSTPAQLDEFQRHRETWKTVFLRSVTPPADDEKLVGTLTEMRGLLAEV